MRLADFDYDLPAERIAQVPPGSRDEARMLHVGREGNTDRGIRDLRDLVSAGDLLVLNDTRVVPARLVGRKESGGRVELLLIEPGRGWIKSSRPPRPGTRLSFDEGLTARVVGGSHRCWELTWEHPREDPAEVARRVGRMPLPPYIHRADNDPRHEADAERYQTVFARVPGAVAAPTAGLHFTRAALGELRGRGVEVTFVTLHVGPGTFQPVEVERIEDHAMQAERYHVPEETVSAVAASRERGGRVLAVGTTVVRALESCVDDDGRLRGGEGVAELFIYPGYRFQVVDRLLTNFHLPRSTLLMLVCAFGGRQRILEAYRQAVEREYRFYSYGDAMLIEPAG